MSHYINNKCDQIDLNRNRYEVKRHTKMKAKAKNSIIEFN